MIEFISQLPTEYQEVEYIESSGTQYIDTGFVPTAEDMRVVMDYRYSASPNGKSLFGAEISGNFPITFYSRNATTADFYIGSTYYVTAYDITVRTRYKLDCHANNGSFTANLNGVVKSATYSGSLVKTLNLFLFTNNGQQSTQNITARLYSCQIYDNGTLTRDFVPCYRKSDNVAGMYDLVNGVFYSNAGTGDFAKGKNSNAHVDVIITSGGIISMQYALRRRMMISVNKGLLISDLPLGTLIRIADSDGGEGAANYEIADINNFVSGGVVLVRKDVYSLSKFGSEAYYPNSTLDNLIKTTIYNKMPQQLRDKMINVTFSLYSSDSITRKVFALTYTMAGFGVNNSITEGKALQLYTSNASRIKTYNGSADLWWLSSVHRDFELVRVIYQDGSSNSTYNTRPSNTNGVVPAFVIPADAVYDPTTNADGSYNLVL